MYDRWKSLIVICRYYTLLLFLIFMQVARLTHSISVFTEGILMMKTTLVGIIKVWLGNDVPATIYTSQFPQVLVSLC